MTAALAPGYLERIDLPLLLISAGQDRLDRSGDPRSGGGAAAAAASISTIAERAPRGDDGDRRPARPVLGSLRPAGERRAGSMTVTQMLVIAGAFIVAGIAKGAIGMGLPPIAHGADELRRAAGRRARPHGRAEHGDQRLAGDLRPRLREAAAPLLDDGGDLGGVVDLRRGGVRPSRLANGHGLGRRDPGALLGAGAHRLAAGGVARDRALGQSADRRWRAARWPASPASPPCRSCPTCSRSTSTGTISCRRWASCSCSSSAR